MKTLAKWILAGLAFALGVMAAEHCDAFTVRSIRSLNAAITTGAGSSFTSPPSGVLPFYVPGGGIKWTVLLNFAGATSMTFQIEGQMTDGTWMTIAGPFQVFCSNTTGKVIPMTFNFSGPYQDMRVNLPLRTNGTITADIYVEY